MTFLEAVAVGFGLGLSLAAPPGPVLAKVAHDTAQGRWRQGLLVGLGATSADALFFLLVYAGLLQVLPDRRLLALLALVGVGIMNYFAHQAWRSARQPLSVPPKALDGWVGGFLLAGTSPFNWAWWVTAGATYVLLYGLPLAFGFFTAILLWVLLSVALFAYGTAKIRRFETYVAYASALLLVAFGIFLAYHGLRFWTQA